MSVRIMVLYIMTHNHGFEIGHYCELFSIKVADSLCVHCVV